MTDECPKCNLFEHDCMCERLKRVNEELYPEKPKYWTLSKKSDYQTVYGEDE